MSEAIRKVKVHYRKATLSVPVEDTGTLQDALVAAMKTDLANDAGLRVFPIAEDEQHKGCLNVSASSQAFAAEILHLDGRAGLPVWLASGSPKPIADIEYRRLQDGESSIGEPVYIYVIGNHIAAIERLAFRNTNIARYINGLLSSKGLLPNGAIWQLTPKIEATGGAIFEGGVKKVVVKPHAAMGGEAPSQAPVDTNKSRARKIASALEDMVAGADRVMALLKAIGADETKIEALREAMSADLVIRAKVELSVASVRRKTTAIVPEEIIEQALGELAAEGDITIVSEDGKRKGKLVQLSHEAEVVERDGVIVWEKAVLALNAAVSQWAARGVIDIS